MRTPFLGGTYVSRSRNLAYSRAVNIYPETVETKQGKAVGAFYGTPGLDSLSTLGSGPIRAGIVAMGAAYVVSGNGVYKLTTSSWTGTLLGTIGTVSGNVTMTSNSTQLLISDGVAGYLVTLSTGALTTVATFPAGGATLAYQDGFALTNIAGTNQFNQSNLNDLSVWNALNFSTADGQPGNIQALVDLNREVWVLCDNNVEVWLNAGLAGFAFQRLAGVYMEVGCIAPASAVHNANQHVMWLGQSENGRGIAYMAKGYTPERISTHAIERVWQGYSNITDAIGYTYQQEGHTFYVLSFPSGDSTWVYDTGVGMWHERASLGSDGLFRRHWPSVHFSFNNKNVVGDYRNGNLYAYNLNTYTDAGTTKKWLRSWRAWPPGQEKMVPYRFNSLQIDCQTGVDIPAGTEPLMMLRYSNDGGWNWSSEKMVKAGAVGETAKRVLFRRLGSTRRGKERGSGLDRVFELSS